ncbi:SusD/RagB family nutrient-binding outer membrane lipoprotein [Sphingobacterium anhuiense]|uniref:SusD/RagB family nutrient-binding outer membrane lipoprotein n=1 Tax=Sphingobacterium anhuiense TaxID=493780 RepID=A0ABW5Z561_9SPHI
MKNKFKLIYAICFTAIIGCRTGDDLYLSPNDPADASLATMLTALEVNTFQNVEGDLARIGSIMVQHTAGTAAQYADYQNYRITPGDWDNVWVGLYAGTMNNAKLLMDKAGAENPHYSGIAKVIMAINLSVATDLWGDVPYSEAFKIDEGIRAPKLDTQEDIYKSIDGLLEAAITDFQTAKEKNIFLPGTDDLMGQGNMSKWTKVAYTLRARYLNRTSSKVQGTEAKVLEYLSKGLNSNSDNLEAVHSAVGGSQNQWGSFQNQRFGYMVGNKVFVDRLNSKTDPRLKYFLSPNTKGVYIGGDITKETVESDAAVVGQFFAVEKNYPIVTYYEAKFIEAEVKQRQGSNVSSVLNDAIKANVDYVTGGKESSATIANYTTATKADIMTEKWVAMFCQGIESFNDFRRTGIPMLAPRPKTAGAELDYIPKRYPFSLTTTLYNPNAKNIPMNVAVWWGM